MQRVDAGEYRCRLSISTTMVESQPITIEVEGQFTHGTNIWCFSGRPHFSGHILYLSIGLPTLIHQPEDRNVTRNTPFTLSCDAVGPPDPVQIRWLRDGLPDSDFRNSSDSYTVSGETTNRPCLSPSDTYRECVFHSDLLNSSNYLSFLLSCSCWSGIYCLYSYTSE